ncbi:hypothetical protein HELRODRAFT_77628 [Helobdella robusta]|uniref:Guanylate cyclase n=1 Tax=Helobdella robusta TaxID=6412 RepID=T1G311_HELRO|nr:hypothetical protein HELRODRAFT_77628 [Helobdella robusta]ESO05553.1 hypothetical protein HELRODRAFT_77628 [Helobdella robusta]
MLVSVCYSNMHSIKLTKENLVELVQMKELQHDNLLPFLGACTDDHKICYVVQYCSRGSLQDMLSDYSKKLDWSFKFSFVMDIVKGMTHLQKSFVKFHEKLTSNVCMLDNRWVVKITGFGLKKFRSLPKFDETTDDYYRDLLWTAPEILRSNDQQSSSPAGNVFSFGIICHEIVFRKYPYQDSGLSAKDIIQRVMHSADGIFRPAMSPHKSPSVSPSMLELIQLCWHENPANRPTFENISKVLLKLNKTNVNIVDNMLEKLEKYANDLEKIVEQRTEELVGEKKKTDLLLNSMLPPFVAEELKAGRRIEPKMYQSATVYFSDIVGFTTLSSQSTPMQIVDLLNDLYGAFDDTISRHNVYKVETIGDSYMVVSGLPQVTERHVVEICNMALDLLGIVKTFKIRHRPEMTLMLRIGIHSGPCAAGIVGHTMPRYCLFGDTVNTASRIESTGQALKIHMSTAARDQLLQFPGYVIELRGPTELKGKGKMVTYWLVRKKATTDELE